MIAHVSGIICTILMRDYLELNPIDSLKRYFQCEKPMSPIDSEECVNILTSRPLSGSPWIMAALSALKKKALMASGTLNPHPEAVRSELFTQDFFDPHDRAQVKYEMLRAQRVQGLPITEAGRLFGFSRESFYQIREAFENRGFRTLLPEKRGRKGPLKLKGKVLQFARDQLQENPELEPAQLSVLIRQRFGLQIHRTTVWRALKKKPRAPRLSPRGARRSAPRNL